MGERTMATEHAMTSLSSWPCWQSLDYCRDGLQSANRVRLFLTVTSLQSVLPMTEEAPIVARSLFNHMVPALPHDRHEFKWLTRNRGPCSWCEPETLWGACW